MLKSRWPLTGAFSVIVKTDGALHSTNIFIAVVVWQRAGRGRGGGRGRQRGGGAGGDGRGAGGRGGAGGLVRLGHRRQGLGQAQEVHRELPAGQRQVTGVWENFTQKLFSLHLIENLPPAQHSFYYCSWPRSELGFLCIFVTFNKLGYLRFINPHLSLEFFWLNYICRQIFFGY